MSQGREGLDESGSEATEGAGARMIRLLAIARGLEDEGQYNVAKLFRATAWGIGVRATLDRPRPNSGLYEAMDDAIADLREAGFDAPVAAMAHALTTLRAGGFPMLADLPGTNACRHCGQVMLGEPPDVCPACRSRRLTFQPFPAAWYTAPIEPDDILQAMADNLSDIERITSEAADDRADQGVWPFRAILAHLLGSEELLAGRARRMLDEDEPVFVSIDPNDIGVSDEGAETGRTPISVLLEDLTQARRNTIERFSTLPSEAWQRGGSHPEFGRLTVTQQLAYLVRHEQWHLAEMEERARE